MQNTRPLAAGFGLTVCLVSGVACGPDPAMGDRTALGDKWFQRAKIAYRGGDFDDAQNSAKQALAASPHDTETRILAGRVALSHLDYAEALRVTQGLDTTAAHGIRGRAEWYTGNLEGAADELEAVARDPAAKDPWARDVAGLARRGTGRHPFEMEGGVVSQTVMPPAGAAMVVPCELEGERVFALVATASGDVILDSNERHEPAWVSIRFDRIEIKDVPALTADLSAFTRQLGAPVKALLGVNLLRHAHATFDRRGDQFIVRRQEAAAPPNASPVPLWYLRGGGLLLHADVSTNGTGGTPLLVDSTRAFPVALTDELWKRAGIDPERLERDQTDPSVRLGELPHFRVAGFEIPRVPGFEGPSILPPENGEDMDLGGVLGAGLLAEFRVTLGEDGRTGWLEPDPTLADARHGGVPVPPQPRQPFDAPPPPPGGAPPATGARPN